MSCMGDPVADLSRLLGVPPNLFQEEHYALSFFSKERLGAPAVVAAAYIIPPRVLFDAINEPESEERANIRKQAEEASGG